MGVAAEGVVLHGKSYGLFLQRVQPIGKALEIGRELP